MIHFQNQIRRIAVAAVAIATVALMSGCAIHFSPESRLERWNAGESRDMSLVRGVRSLNVEFAPACNESRLSDAQMKFVHDPAQYLAYLKAEVCPNISEWRAISGFTKSDFGKGAILAAGLIRPGLVVDADDIVETSTDLHTDGRAMRPNLVTRVIRKNALKERDPSCYWDGQSGRFDAFATGGVVCPAEGWDWRDQKWAKK